MLAISGIQFSDVAPLPAWISLLAISFAAWKFTYNIFLHPLRKYPGPVIAGGSVFWHFYWIYIGALHIKIKDLHDQYGDVVRIAPNVLIYRSPQAWKDICGHRKAGAGSFLKDDQFYPLGPSGHSIINANDADHSRERRLLAHAFSEKAMRNQEALLQSYVDLLVERLRGKANSQESVDMTSWYNYTTFDIIGDLAFGEPFDCLKAGSYHTWVTLTFLFLKGAALMRPFLCLLPPSAVKILVPERIKKMRNQLFDMSREKVRRRLSIQTSRPDFITQILNHNDDRGMSRREIEANANILILAGSETTATLLSGCTFYLLTHPAVYKTLVQEIRGAFQKEEDITFTSVAQLRYLHAALEETLRMYPPVPGILPRKVPAGGAVINGQFVHEGATVSMGYFSTFRSKSNFAEADSFAPERWLDHDNPRFAADRREALQPFSYGPRNCLGKNLAYAEMRLIAAKVLWNFDMELQEGCHDWDKQKAYTIWQKKSLMVNLTAVQH